MGPNISLQRTLRDTIYPLKTDKKANQCTNSKPIRTLFKMRTEASNNSKLWMRTY